MGITGASGRLSLFLSKSLSSETSMRFKDDISLASLSIFGLIGLSAPSGTGIVIFSTAAAASV